MKIFFRCSEKQETVSKVDRWKNFEKSYIVKKCWRSLQQSISTKDEIYILHDEISYNLLEYLKNTCKCNYILYEIPKHNIEDRLHTYILLDYVQKQLNISNNPNEIFYLLEDDYLHINNALFILKDPFPNFNGYVLPYDYPDRYFIDKKPGIIYVGDSSHWRNNISGTYTFLTKASILKEDMSIIVKYAPHNPTIELFQKRPCISPIPGVATHLTPYHMSPVVDWEKIWDETCI